MERNAWGLHEARPVPVVLTFVRLYGQYSAGELSG